MEKSNNNFIAHFAVCCFIIYFYGGEIQSLSIDVAHHFVLISELMKTGDIAILKSNNIGEMAIYPRYGHWIAAGLGQVIGSGFSAMWVVGLVSIYACYYFIFKVILEKAGMLGAAIFFIIIFIFSYSRGAIGFEIVGNFFFSQLLGMAFYFASLYMIVKFYDKSAWIRVFIILAMTSFIIGVHILPAYHLLAATGVLFLAELAITLRHERRLDMARAAAFGVFLAGGAALALLHPASANMRRLAQNDGVLDFRFSAGMLWPVVLACLCVAAASGLRFLLPGRRASGDLALTAALSASVAIAVAQYLALVIFDDGSLYAVKKHMFLIITLTAMVLALLLADVTARWRVAVLGEGEKPAFLPVMAAFAAGVFTFLTLNRPGVPIRPITDLLNYADRAVEQGFSAFKPGNTVVVAQSVHPVVQYMASLAAFQAPSGRVTVGLVTGEFDMSRNAEYLLVDRHPLIEKACPENVAAGKAYVIIPTACKLAFPVGAPVAFSAGAAGLIHLDTGWWAPEPWGVWGRGASHRLVLRPTGVGLGEYELEIGVNPFIAPGKPEAKAELVINGRSMGTWRFTGAEEPAIRVRLPADLLGREDLRIELRSLDGISPAQIGLNGDQRVLGVGLRTLNIRRVGGSGQGG